MNEIRIIVEGLNELTEAVKCLAGLAGGQGVGRAQQPPQQTPAPMAQNYGVNQMATPAPVQQAGVPVPVGQAQQASGTALPTTPVTPGYSLEQLQVAAAGLTSMGKMPQVMGILQRFGIQAMTELPKERYGEFVIALREAGAQI